MVAPSSRTMKEYEEQVAALRKDNFNLKLRVYFLEERLEASAPHSSLTQQNLTMQNIELKVLVLTFPLRCSKIPHAPVLVPLSVNLYFC